jgi:hypothetical protein
LHQDAVAESSAFFRRFIAVDAPHPRRSCGRQNLKRGGGVSHVSLDEAVVVGRQDGLDLVALDDALNALARIDARKGRVVEMRFFGGLSVDETAAVLKVSPVTVRRDWNSAKITRRIGQPRYRGRSTTPEPFMLKRWRR